MLVAIRLSESRHGNSADSVITWIKQYFGWPIDALKAILELLHQGPIFTSAHDFLLGPALPATTAAVVFAYLIAVMNAPFRGRPVVDHFWPSALHVLDHRLEKFGADAADAYAPDKPLLDREEDIRWLMAFAGVQTSAGAAWSTLSGMEGVGKTHLALSWLKNLKELGWDVGILEKGTATYQIEHAAVRRDTAIVIDDVLREDPQELWRQLDALLKKRRCFSLRLAYFFRKPVRLRVLLVDQVIVECPENIDLNRTVSERIERARREGRRLSPLPESTLRLLAPTLSLEKIKEADGRPLYVMSDGTEFERRAQNRLDKGDLAGNRVLALAALVGPLSHKDRKRIPGTDASIRLLTKLFEGESRSVLSKTIPELRPTPLADEILLRWAADHSEPDWQELFRAALAVNTTAVSYRLGSLWRRSNLSQEKQNLRAEMQKMFDEIRPDVVAVIHNEAQQVVERIVQGLIADERRRNRSWMIDALQPIPLASLVGDPVAGSAAAGPILSETAVARIEWLGQSRPFDPHVRTADALAAVCAIYEHGQASDFAELERAGERLTMIAAAFPDHIPIRAVEAMVRSILANGAASRFSDLERWGSRLADIAAAFPDEFEIRRQEAVGIHNTILFYAVAGRFDDLERWADRLAGLVSVFPQNPFLAQICGRTAGIAIFCYGRAKRFEDVERWGRRFAATSAAFANDPDIRLLEAFHTINAILHYGLAGRFDDLERWSERLATLATAFPHNPAFVVELAKAASNAISSYGDAKRFDDLERWGNRLAVLVATIPDHAQAWPGELKVPGTLELMEAKGSVNAMYSYGATGRFDDLERWSKRLAAVTTKFANGLEILCEGAKGASNAIAHYASAQRLDDVERWGTRLAAVVACNSDSPELSIMEANGAVSAMSAYGRAHRFDELERWGQRLTSVADKFPNNAKIRFAEAAGAHNALVNYQKVDDAAAWMRWTSRLASVARDSPDDAKIQDLAEHFGVNYVRQAMRGWPYGNPTQ